MCVRNAEVRGSIPLISTNKINELGKWWIAGNGTTCCINPGPVWG